MNKYVLFCGSTVDLSADHLERRNIKFIPFKYYMNDVEYSDDLGKTMPYKEFYRKIKLGAVTRTSQIVESEYIKYLTPYLEEGYDIVNVVLSSGISGTYNSAMLAKQELEEQYPERKVYVVDSLAASSGYGLLMDTLADLRDEGYNAEELVDAAEKIKYEVHHLFFSTDLTSYIRGGRVSKTAGFIGTVLKICPVLFVNKEGKLIQNKKVRTKKKAIIEIVDEMLELVHHGNEYQGKCYISHSDCLEDAQEVVKLIEEKIPSLKGKVLINSIGTTIGSHTGSGTVALFFYGTKRERI